MARTDMSSPPPLVTPPTEAQRRAAARQVAAHAHDTQDAVQIMLSLGLIEPPPAPPPAPAPPEAVAVVRRSTSARLASERERKARAALLCQQAAAVLGISPARYRGAYGQSATRAREIIDQAEVAAAEGLA